MRTLGPQPPTHPTRELAVVQCRGGPSADMDPAPLVLMQPAGRQACVAAHTLQGQAVVHLVSDGGAGRGQWGQLGQ